MHVTALVSAAVGLLGIVVVARWMPGKVRPAKHATQKEPALSSSAG
ncbi:hypothetical protein ACFQYP_31380 [Nonomuraea antimicrobica]